MMNQQIHILKNIAEDTEKRITEVLEEYGEKAGEKIKIGAYGSPSSRVDIAAEENIIRAVEESDYPFNIFSEERGYIKRGYSQTLIVDPLDGSYNAENDIPFYSISLAISDGDLQTVKYALVRDIPHRRNYWAVRGEGAFLENKRLKTRGDRSLFIVYLGKKAHESSFKIARKARRTRCLGSASLEMCMVAEGSADLFLYRFVHGGALRIVDIAAAYLIVREAGGIVVDERLEPLNMGVSTEERKNVIAAANRETLKILQ